MGIWKIIRVQDQWFSWLAEAIPDGEWWTVDALGDHFREKDGVLEEQPLGHRGSGSWRAFCNSLEVTVKNAAVLRLAETRDAVTPTKNLRLPQPTYEIRLNPRGRWLSRKPRWTRMLVWGLVATVKAIRQWWKPVGAVIFIGATGANAVKAYGFFADLFDHFHVATLSAAFAVALGVAYAAFRHFIHD